ncbi:MAG: hypothetical protein MR332_07300 [Fusicatenibacter sp.]|nr:hypothetical protein [Fusicatenibacter sp.]
MTYQVPTSYDKLNAAGWEAEKLEILDQELAPKKSEIMVQLINGYGSLFVTFYNASASTKTVRDSSIVMVTSSVTRLNDNYLDEQVNSLSTPDGISVGVSTAQEFYDLYPDGYVKKDTMYTYGPDSKHAYAVTIGSGKDDPIRQIQVTNYPDEETADTSYESTKPSYYTDEYYAENGMNGYALVSGENTFEVCWLVQDYVDAGWEIEKKPEYIASRGTDTIYLRKDTRSTLKIDVYNASNDALIPEYCLITEVSTVYDSFSEELQEAMTTVLAEEGITVGMLSSVSPLCEQLDMKGILYEMTENNDLFLYPYGQDDGRFIRFLTSTIDNDRVVIGMTLSADTKIESAS